MRLPRGVRARSTVAAAAAVSLVLVVVAAGVLIYLRSALLSSAAASAADRVEQIAGQLASDSPSSQDLGLVASSGPTSVIQILDSRGNVALASSTSSTTAFVDPVGVGSRRDFRSDALPGQAGDYAVSVGGVAGPGGPWTVAVAVDVAAVTATLATVAAVLLVALPLLVLTVAASTWVLVGRSLRPVDLMRAHADAISTEDLSRRLPVPQPDDEIARLAVTLNSMLARLEAGNEVQRRFAGDASHELRGPLSTLRTALELGSRDPSFLGARLIDQQLLPEVLRLQNLVDDLLLLARADERALPSRRSDVDLDDLVEQEVERLRTTSGPAVRGSTVPVRIQGDLGQLRRLLRNLGDNAMRHARTFVEITCSVSPEGALLSVADDGPGIPAGDRHRVFDRFVRLETDRARSTGGTGLGLAIVAEIASAHGGFVRVASSSSGGALLLVGLPTSYDESDPLSSTISR